MGATPQGGQLGNSCQVAFDGQSHFQKFGDFILLFFLPCYSVCRILVPRRGIEPWALRNESRVLTPGPPEKSLLSGFVEKAHRD